MNFYKNIKENAILGLKIAIITSLTFGLGAGINYVLAQSGWSPPTVAPPGGQIAPPVNVGDITQYKMAALVVGSEVLATDWGFVVPDAKSGFGIGLTEPQATVHIKGDSGDDPSLPVLKVEDNSGGAVLLLDSLGLTFLNAPVGIGTVSPNAKLHTVGSVRFEDLPNVDPLLQEDVVFISTNGRLTRGAGVHNGTFIYPAANFPGIWSEWVDVGFSLKTLNLSFTSTNANFRVPPVTFTIPSDGVITYPVILDNSNLPAPIIVSDFIIERSGNSFRISIFEAHPWFLTVYFTAWR